MEQADTRYSGVTNTFCVGEVTPENQSQQGVFFFFFLRFFFPSATESSVQEEQCDRGWQSRVCVSGQTGASASLQPGCKKQAVCHLCCFVIFLCVLCAHVHVCLVSYVSVYVSLHLKVSGVGERHVRKPAGFPLQHRSLAHYL